MYVDEQRVDTLIDYQLDVSCFAHAQVSLAAREQAGAKYKGGLKELIDAMTEDDGLTALSAWVEIGFDGKSANCGKLNLSKIKEHLNVKDVKNASFQQLANLLGQLALGKRAINIVLQPGGLSYHKAVLQSCEKRSLLSDYVWCKTVGEGAFGRAHLCKYDVCVSRVTFVIVASSVNVIVVFFAAQEPPQRRAARDQTDDARLER